MKTVWAVAIALIIPQFSFAEIAFPGEEWTQSAPEEQGLDEARLQAAVNFLEANAGEDGVRELMIVRNGVVVWAGDNVDHVHGVWSMTKSFTSTALGLLIEDGKAALDTRACQFLPELKEHYSDATLRHFATMTSGYRAQGDEPRGGYTHGPSQTPFLPNADPLFTPPGSKYAYWDSAMNMFGLVLTRIAGEPLEDLFERRIARPIGMDPDEWDWKDFGPVDGSPSVNGGSGNSGKHIHITSRQAARFGLLFLNRGEWDGERIISADWVDAVHQVHVPASMPLGHPESGIDGRGVYGLNWWTNGINADGARKWPGAPESTYAASGFNNNDLFIIPDWKMVVVRLGLDQNDKAISDKEYGEFLRLIGHAFVD